MNYVQIKKDLKKYHWNDSDNSDEIKLKEKKRKELFDNKNSIQKQSKFNELIQSISLKIDKTILNNTVTYLPSFSFRITLCTDVYKDYRFLEEYFFYISIFSNIYTGFYIKTIFDKIHLQNKTKRVSYKPTILRGSINSYSKEFEISKLSIENSFPDFHFLGTDKYFLPFDADNITYTTAHESCLFHGLFADLKKKNYQIIN